MRLSVGPAVEERARQVPPPGAKPDPPAPNPVDESRTPRISDLLAKGSRTTTSGAPRIAPSSVEQKTIMSLPSETRSIRGYRLLQMLGGGAYGVVYRALSPGGVEVAVKEIRFLVTQQESQRELEALKLITSLHHPYLLSLHDFWTEENQLYIAMELADSSLAELARDYGNQGIPHEILLPIFAEAAEALDFLHEKRVLHRDIKPANILLLRGHAKVADLGLAKHNPETVGQTQTVAGTPAFMAPETFGNQLRAASDQYGLALCYAELRLGRQICEGASFLQAMVWHVEKTPNLDGLECWEQTALMKALAKDPDHRFDTCRAFVRAMQPPAPPPPVAPPPARSRWPILTGALAAALPLLAILGWLMLRPKPAWEPGSGFRGLDDAPIVEVAGRRFHERIAKAVGREEVVFRLIPPETTDDPPPFYIMENKAWNGLFKVAAGYEGEPADPDFAARLAELKNRYPQVADQLNQWTKGGRVRDEVDLGAATNALPVLRVSAIEAHCFAQWLHADCGRLPTSAQWLAAAGKSRGVLGPFDARSVEDLRIGDEPETPDVAVGRFQKGPMPVGTALLDRSKLGIRDLAGNGREWTSTPDSTGDFPPTPDADIGLKLIVVLGARYSDDRAPFLFSKETRYQRFVEVDAELGFRVVLNPN